MNFRDMNQRVFAREPIPHVLFQPRIEPWYDWHKIFNSLPDGYQFTDVRQLFDELGVSMRYMHYYTGMPSPVRQTYAPAANINEHLQGREKIITYETPHGILTETQHFTVDQTWRTVGFPVKNVTDLKAVRWLYQHIEYRFDPDAFKQGSDFMGDRGEPQFWVPKSPYQALAQVWMKLEDLIFALVDNRAEVEATMQAIDDSYDPLYEQITTSGMVKIINFGENIHEQLLSPGYFKKYLIPFYEKRASQLHEAGIYSHAHIDGYFRNLLPLLQDLPFDGLEALTPRPQGDVTLEEIKEHIGDKILLDGVPAVLFLDTYSREQLMQSVEQLVSLFHPNLVLGISDEVPQGAGVEAMERTRLIAEYCRDYQNRG